jgi:purine-binding chemotaxis protein CheW
MSAVEASQYEQENTKGMGSASNDESGEQYLTFIMAGEEYGVDILKVQEIRGWERTTPIPNSPKHIKGVINLRGTVVPIIDLRQCFGLEHVEYGPLTVVIVLRVDGAQSSRTMGIVVDAVSDVYSLDHDHLQPAPNMGDSYDTSYIRGLATVGDKMVMLLEINELLDLDDIPNVNELKQHVSAAKADA